MAETFDPVACGSLAQAGDRELDSSRLPLVSRRVVIYAGR